MLSNCFPQEFLLRHIWNEQCEVAYLVDGQKRRFASRALRVEGLLRCRQRQEAREVPRVEHRARGLIHTDDGAGIGDECARLIRPYACARKRGSKRKDDISLLREAVLWGVYEAGEARHEQWKAQQKILCEQWDAELAAEEEALLKG